MVLDLFPTKISPMTLWAQQQGPNTRGELQGLWRRENGGLYQGWAGSVRLFAVKNAEFGGFAWDLTINHRGLHGVNYKSQGFERFKTDGGIAWRN